MAPKNLSRYEERIMKKDADALLWRILPSSVVYLIIFITIIILQVILQNIESDETILKLEETWAKSALQEHKRTLEGLERKHALIKKIYNKIVFCEEADTAYDVPSTHILFQMRVNIWQQCQSLCLREQRCLVWSFISADSEQKDIHEWCFLYSYYYKKKKSIGVISGIRDCQFTRLYDGYVIYRRFLEQVYTNSTTDDLPVVKFIDETCQVNDIRYGLAGDAERYGGQPPHPCGSGPACVSNDEIDEERIATSDNKAKDSAQCSTLCANTQGCLSWTFYNYRVLGRGAGQAFCSLHNSVISREDYHETTSGLVGCVEHVSKRNYRKRMYISYKALEMPAVDCDTRWRNFEVHGKRILTLSNLTKEFCVMACEAFVDCKFWNWDSQRSNCSLLSSMGNKTLQRNAGVHSGSRTCEISVAYSVDLEGDIIRKYEQVLDWKVCSDRCRKDETCNYWAWILTGKVCTLLTSKNWTLAPSIDAISGDRFTGMTDDCTEKGVAYESSEADVLDVQSNIYSWKICSNLCRKTSIDGCRYWTWLRPGDNGARCFLFSGSSGKRASEEHISGSRICGMAAPTCPEQDLNFDDSSMKSLPNVSSWRACSSSCREQTGCEAWSYVKKSWNNKDIKDKTCNLKDSSLSTKTVKAIGYESGAASCGATDLCEWQSIEVNGRDLTQYGDIPSALECSKKCRENQECVYWTWKTPEAGGPWGSKCFLKASLKEKTGVKFCVSGDRFCVAADYDPETAEEAEMLSSSVLVWGGKPFLPSNVLDKNKGTFFHSETNEKDPWLQLRFEETNVRGVILTNRQGHGQRLKNVVVRAGFSRKPLDNPVVGRFDGPGEDGKVYVIEFDNKVMADRVTIQIEGTGTLQIAELEIIPAVAALKEPLMAAIKVGEEAIGYKPRNEFLVQARELKESSRAVIKVDEEVVRYKPKLDFLVRADVTAATSSSQYSHSYRPQLAIDGYDRSFFHSKSNEIDPWMQVTFPETGVNGITLKNRRNCCGDRLKNIVVHAGELTDAIVGRFEGPGKTAADHYIALDKRVTTDRVTIQMIGKGTLQIAELDVIIGVSCGAPPPADTCALCPGGKSGCKGDCDWCQDRCQQKVICDALVTCNGEMVLGCDKCTQSGGDPRSWCTGDCTWCQDKCQPSAKCEDYEASLVYCGGHTATNCAGCSHGKNESWCGGDCAWCQGKCQTKTQCAVVAGTLLVCGRHHAENCEGCLQGTTNSRKCGGECKWCRDACHPKDVCKEPPQAVKRKVLASPDVKRKESLFDCRVQGWRYYGTPGEPYHTRRFANWQVCASHCFNDPVCNYWNWDESWFTCHFMRNISTHAIPGKKPENWASGTRDCYGFLTRNVPRFNSKFLCTFIGYGCHEEGCTFSHETNYITHTVGSVEACIERCYNYELPVYELTYLVGHETCFCRLYQAKSADNVAMAYSFHEDQNEYYLNFRFL